MENMTGPEFNGDFSLLCWAPSQPPNDGERHYDVLYPKDMLPQVVGPEFTYCGFYRRWYVLIGTILTGSTNDNSVHLDSGWEYTQRGVWLDTINQVLALGLDVTVSRVADSMTKALLQNSNVTIPGSSYANQVMVRVQWAWMILPTLLVILGNVFLVWTTCASRKKSIWKSSVLAFLFHGLEDQRERDGCMTSSGMEKQAEAMHVQLHSSHYDARVILREN
ncbi:unnamed protein product [Penicillium salamii]|uniref:Uncharacterized protein n=1 Tax=Penicillium salamii TaxID=1612424 RepID=A0A9W4I3P0_9EURO|nr:unnamed protein product [Penicillium salamii]